MRGSYNNTNETNYKYILSWTEGYGDKRLGWTFGSERFKSEQCPETRCFFTSNRSLFGKGSVNLFDAILFHQRSFSWQDAPNPKLRRKEQYYVHWMMESPAHLHYDLTSLKKLSNYFNWSMSYRRDAKFSTPYGKITQVNTFYGNEKEIAFDFKIKEVPKGKDLDELINTFGENNKHLANKSGNSSIAAWFVSNCDSKSKREQFVEDLKR